MGILENWQSYAAPAIVLVTILLLVRRWKKSRKGSGCGGDCGCPVVKKPKVFKDDH